MCQTLAACDGLLVALLVACAGTACCAGVSASQLDDTVHTTSATTPLEGIKLIPQMAMINNMIRSDPELHQLLSQYSSNVTGFTPSDDATKALVRSVGRYAGVALQNETFMMALVKDMIVPGVWTTAKLRAAAPTTLTTIGGEPLQVEKDPKAPYGILIGGFPIALANQATQGTTTILHMLSGVVIPPSERAQVDIWQGGSTSTHTSPAEDVEVGASEGAKAAVGTSSGSSMAAVPSASGAVRAAESATRAAVPADAMASVAAAAAAALLLAALV